VFCLRGPLREARRVRDNGRVVRLSFTYAALAIALAVSLALLGGCSADGPTPTPVPTPTPPYGLPPITLPADEAPHDFQTEWWYFNAHFADDLGARYALHDVVFQVQQLDSGRTLYVRQIGLADSASGTHVNAERLRTADAPLVANPGAFEIAFGNGSMSGDGGERYRLIGSARGVSYDLTLTLASADVAGSALLHDDDGLVDFGEAGVTYYYSQPRLDLRGTLTTADGSRDVTGLAWLDKQWGDFQPVSVFWDWASVQLDDGTDLMLTRLMDGDRAPLDVYATLRRPGGEVRRLGAAEFSFTPLADEWVSAETGTAYRTRWRVEVPSEGLAFTLEPLVVESEFSSAYLGVVYWEAGVDVVGDAGDRLGQGFIELNWARNFLAGN
jgi:predicted secreted hydrolase